MARWMRPEEELPNCFVGDRVLIVVCEREYPKAPYTNRLVLLEAEEDGWKSYDPTYSGYTPEDGVLWTYETDLVKIADIVGGAS